MSTIRRGRWLAGFILGLGPASSLQAQDFPPALPPGDPTALPALPASAVPMYVLPRPPLVQVPPGGAQPAWRPDPIDPVALQRQLPKHVPHKARSWTWRRLQGKIWGYPEEFEPRPLGAAMYEANKIMVANGAEARLVLHDYDFVPGSSELNPRGGDQLAKFAAQLAISPYPLIVERTSEDPNLAESRRFAVLARLARGPSPVTSDRVLVGVSRAAGMSGTDAQVIAGNALGRVQQYGPPIPINSNGVNSPSGVTSGAGSNFP